MRQCKNWLQSLAEYVEDTESPRHFWFWSGIFCMSCALQRKVWIPYGIDPIYPNIYILLVAPPGKCRKGAPTGFSKRLLTEAQLPTFVDSPTKRAFTKQLAENAKNYAYSYNGITRPQSICAIVSKELSSFLATDPKGMIEVLTDLFDSDDVWKYKTSDKGEDKLYNVCVSCLLASTPMWIARNLPEEAIGGGFTSRLLMIHGEEKYKRVAIPSVPNEALWKKLLHDINWISTKLIGEFEWEIGAKDLFTEWYNTLGEKTKATSDERLHGTVERLHINALKTAMCLRVSYSDQLILTKEDLKKSITIIDTILPSTARALGAQGANKSAVSLERIIMQLKTLKETTFTELLKMNYRDTTKPQLEELVDTVEAMGQLKRVYEGTKEILRWQKAKE